jgi:hypothetical protein
MIVIKFGRAVKADAASEVSVTTLLKRAVAEVEKLSAEDQDALASRWLAEIEDERQWTARFAATTDDQWDRLVAEARRDIAAGGVVPLDEVFPSDEPQA